MKRMLWLLFSLLLISSVAMADQIGIFSDATGHSCNLGNIVGQFSNSAAVIHQFATGATGSRFKITFPAGTTFFGFNAWQPCEFACDGQTFPYGQCLTGSIVIGTITAIYGPGVIKIVPPDGSPNVTYYDCLFGENLAGGGTAYVGIPGDPCTIAVESSTWGQVKSLYR